MRAVLVCLLVVCAGCRPAGEDLINWDRPPGQLVSSVASVQERFTFPIVTPRGLHGLKSLSATPPAVWFVYDDPDFGRIWIAESPPDMADPSERMAGYRSVADHARTVRVRGGVSLLVHRGKVATGEFVQRGVQFQILGPDLSEEEVIRIAGLI
jgi:hypothetical protein